ncbi:beta-1,6-galactofuranosyltransferase [Pseudolactococcus insecticola]|uniref:Beta-1,6-galactofuranosyltransferase n=1 Tax=Pseudolactococcus insecticola TaxID=2709158 RepID=A0A6A0B653_9LACT|nr:beta-1,6-galactofuranosyltransferase [Lactococcus insecticola]GFH40712.1 beta-1,6-galactofuranosyltransferase [Lactococcus insecticola]
MTNWITRLNGAANKEKTASGFIANHDAAQSAKEIGFSQINYFRYNGKEESPDALNARLDGILAAVRPGDTIVYQYPMWQIDLKFEQRFLAKVRRKSGAKVIALVWDILSWLHDDRDRDYTQDWSLKALNEFDLVICANPKMAQRLKTQGGVTKPILSWDLSDSRYDGPLREKTFQKKLFFVGRLDKSDFSQYKAKTKMALIGGMGPKSEPLSDEVLHQENLIFHGEMPNDEIPFMFDGGFGVINYATDNLDNAFFKGNGTYGQYNNPLKLSQYLAGGIPVIVASNSAHADFVREKNIGLVLDDLNQIDAILDAMTAEDYQKMLDALKPYQEAVSTGFFTKRALMEALRITQLGLTDNVL